MRFFSYYAENVTVTSTVSVNRNYTESCTQADMQAGRQSETCLRSPIFHAPNIETSQQTVVAYTAIKRTCSSDRYIATL